MAADVLKPPLVNSRAIRGARIGTSNDVKALGLGASAEGIPRARVQIIEGTRIWYRSPLLGKANRMQTPHPAPSSAPAPGHHDSQYRAASGGGLRREWIRGRAPRAGEA